jgi:hypothetical protein
MPVQRPGERITVDHRPQGASRKGPAMAKGMNKRKEVKKPKKEAAKAPVKVSSSNTKVTISPGKDKD